MTVSVESGDSGWTEYVLGIDELREGSKLIMGDIELGDAICKSTDYKSGQYFRIVISFAKEENISQKKGREISKEFMKLLMHGYRDDEYHQDIVEHTDTDNLHYHVRVPKLNLLTGTQLHYHYLSDIDRKDKIHAFLEAKYNLLSPFEKRKLQPDARQKIKNINRWREDNGQKPFDLSTKKGRAEAEERLSDYIGDGVINGLIESLDEVFEELKVMGFVIAKVGHDNGKDFDYVTVHNEDGKIRLKGDKYGERFYEHDRENRAEAIRSGRSLEGRSKDDRPSLDEAKESLDRENNRRSHFIEKRFRTARERALSSHQAPSPSDRAGTWDTGADKEKQNERKALQRSAQSERKVHRQNKILGEVDDGNRIDIIGRVREARKRAEARNRNLREQTESDIRRVQNKCRNVENELSKQLGWLDEARNQRRLQIDHIADEFIQPTAEDYRTIAAACTQRQFGRQIERSVEGIFRHFGKKFNHFKRAINRGNKELIEAIKLALNEPIEGVIMEELNRFKRDINLAEYAQSFGYTVDKNKSTKVSPVLKKDGDTLIVGQDSRDGHYIYFNANNDNDEGSIIDFLKNRTGETLGHIRKRLRKWLGMEHPQIERVEVKAASLDEIELGMAKDKALAFWQSIKEQTLFMGELRAIPNKYLMNSEASKDIKFDGEQWYFALRDSQNEICGVEVRNKEGRNARVGDGHKKGIFIVGGQAPDNCKKIIITESTIDAKSAEVIAGSGNYWSHTFVSIGGNAGIIAKTALKELCDRLPNAEIIIATDNDTAGEKHSEKIKDIIGHHREYKRFRPTRKDLNDDLPSFRTKQMEKQQQKTNTQGLKR